MSNTITSEGHGWKLISHDDGTMSLKLVCPYGTIQIAAMSGEPLMMLYDVERQYEQLKAMPPVQKAVEA